jgi:RNA polymerase sigma-70 factor (ECF subfamily)
VIVHDFILHSLRHFLSPTRLSAADAAFTERRGCVYCRVPAPPWDVFHSPRPRTRRPYSKIRPLLISPRLHPIGNKLELQAVSSMSAGVEGKLDVLDPQDQARFEQLVLPHLDAAFNLSRWLLRGRADAEDVAQESMMRAFRFFRGFHGGDARAWLLQIVRNTCYTWLEKNRSVDLTTEFNEELHQQPSVSPETLAIAGDNRERLTRALEELPVRFREVLILRELEGCSYKEIAAITSVPIGTVMSALARARQRLQRVLTQPAAQQKQAAETGGRP